MIDPKIRHLFPEPPTLVLYHAECADGFGAAWALWKRYPTSRFLPVKHGEPPLQNLGGERIVIVDFSYPRPVLERLAKEAASLLVLDHHITAQQALSDLPYAYFDQTRSGAVLAWQWAHDAPVPWLLQYIQDKDLWQWALPHSREISAALASYPFDFALWDSFQQQELEREGRAILRYENELVAKLATHAVSSSYPFCIIWHDRNGRRYYSMRSREDGVDVGTIASSFGGGGHTHAAGFSIPLRPDGTVPDDPRLPQLRM
jgi:oligoribonuclease NrnB/cAMP/cGMP phosphodiesterase (DHH superfamily)